MDASRREFIHELDEQDRYLQERKGQDALNLLKVNPHRVQLFSLNEIWKCVQDRLIELEILQDPDADSLASDSDSTDFEENFDFMQKGPERIGKMMYGKKPKDKKQKSLKDLMKQNDILMINGMLQKIIEHERRLEANVQELSVVNKSLDRFRTWQNEIGQYQTEVANNFSSATKQAEENHKSFLAFKQEEFPQFMTDYKDEVITDLIKDVNQVQGELVTTLKL